MYCPAPNIKTLVQAPIDPLNPQIVHMWFKMDGIQELRDFSQNKLSISRFIYYPDPVFNKFPGDDHIRKFKLSEEVLDLYVSMGVIATSTI